MSMTGTYWLDPDQRQMQGMAEDLASPRQAYGAIILPSLTIMGRLDTVSSFRFLKQAIEEVLRVFEEQIDRDHEEAKWLDGYVEEQDPEVNS